MAHPNEGTSHMNSRYHPAWTHSVRPALSLCNGSTRKRTVGPKAVSASAPQSFAPCNPCRESLSALELSSLSAVNGQKHSASSPVRLFSFAHYIQ